MNPVNSPGNRSGSPGTRSAAYGLLATATCLLFLPRSTQQDPHAAKQRPPLGAGSLPAKASDRSRDIAERAASPFTQEAELSIQRWLDSLAAHPENLKNPPLDACANLSARAAERFLRDPDHGWSPLLDVSRYAYLTDWEAMLPFHKALLERWAELDAGSLVMKLPPPDDQDKAMAPATALLEKAIESADATTAGRLLQHWFDGVGFSNPSPAFGKITEKLMQTWAGSDPTAAWQWLTDKNLVGSMLQGAARGYLNGLQNPDWPALVEAARQLPDASLFAGSSPQAAFRQEAMRRWGLEDPVAALGALDIAPQPVARNNTEAYLSESIADSPQALLIVEWLKEDLGTQSKLEAWQPGHLDREETFAAIARSTDFPPEVRDAARNLIHDPQHRAAIDSFRETEKRFQFTDFSVEPSKLPLPD
ncbi:hypothetical protein [Haloferula sp. BvORR071]|uniref:hypothetical protein n=1 Tax=Haloferula sp. BvORR071 TaxID=1396141 RepID=UPI00055372BC|nr:hypothetical protein [Haloferula sp. BvORR071]